MDKLNLKYFYKTKNFLKLYKYRYKNMSTGSFVKRFFMFYSRATWDPLAFLIVSERRQSGSWTLYVYSVIAEVALCYRNLIPYSNP